MNKKGFTLVEIMVVVAIIGLLASIGIPSILDAYERAQQSAKRRNVADVSKAKSQLTLPVGVGGGQGQKVGDAPSTNLLTLLSIKSLRELDVGGDPITTGVIGSAASY
jgi:prepilin-type N-terminal cleavage/methylation domain-containing protein